MDPVAIFLILAIPIASVYLLFYHKKRVNDLSSPPGPRGLPFIGHFYQIYKSPCAHEYISNLSKQYGSLMTLHMGSVPALVVSSPKMAQEVLKTQDLVFCSRAQMTGSGKLSYNGLEMAFAPYGEHWRNVRKMCTLELFTQKRAQFNFRPVREDEVSRMVDRLSKAAAASEDVNAYDCFTNFATSIISRVAFGKRYDEDNIGKEKFQRMVADIEAMFAAFFVKDFFPMFGWIDRLSGVEAILDRNFNEMDTFYQELIDEHLKPDRPESLNGDLIDVMLKNKGSFLTMDSIKAILLNVFSGGIGTTGSALVFAMTALLRNQRVMKKAQEEVRSVIGKKEIVDEDDIQKLPYLRAVVKEVLRLYPPGPLLIPRVSMESCILGEDEDHMYMIKPNTIVYVNTWGIGRDPKYWKNPLEFMPERFFERPDLNYTGQQFEYLPFGSGRRICAGIIIGQNNVEVGLANLLYNFDWEPPAGKTFEDIDDQPCNGLTLGKKNPLYIRPKIYVHP
ncbi:5-OH-xanthotoxin synthase [Heracleum sosnowskyi]|uniref:5-OH-xanthotoxin synthase n=1 Tax=Heracleum sosnowskyi TaxID=360622 RepID=A0AAD8IAA1_9APIA|nr:5-OH-xanthotoxin synthase [Heracleum sosnowskyi]